MAKIRIAITGGHLTPAMAVIDEIRSRHPEWDIIFIGRRTVFEGSTTESEEERIITGKNVQFLPLTTGRFRRSLDLLTAKSLGKIPLGVWQSVAYCRKYRPDVILSFGGYVAVPVAIAAALGNIPIITHEQTESPGLANRFIARLSKVVCVSSPEAVSRFQHPQVVLTGLPIRMSLFHPPEKPDFEVSLSRPILYVMGGMTGSAFINTLIRGIVGKLLASYTVIHQAGRQWVSQAKSDRQSLRGDKRKHYFVSAYFDESDHSWILRHSALVIGRSGANTVAELEAFRIPSILIPLPNSSGNEQFENARRLEKSGLAAILEQDSTTPQVMTDTIAHMIAVHPSRSLPQVQPLNPSALIVSQLEKYI
jgi:UDP-N-acetylglucosamine--N-acetylmuramyl-(pentapeptide) pyrophosphoryl-undecaprenol N-acetylglucosamine transferase